MDSESAEALARLSGASPYVMLCSEQKRVGRDGCGGRGARAGCARVSRILRARQHEVLTCFAGVNAPRKPPAHASDVQTPESKVRHHASPGAVATACVLFSLKTTIARQPLQSSADLSADAFMREASVPHLCLKYIQNAIGSLATSQRARSRWVAGVYSQHVKPHNRVQIFFSILSSLYLSNVSTFLPPFSRVASTRL